ncbi:MAG: tetratricopeptide repeat protein [Pseudoxanthomonas sp.]
MAIDDLLDEHEQGERVRNWLKNNGVSLLAGIALGLAVIFGWQWWQQRQQQQHALAYQNYQTAIDGLQGKDGKPADLKQVQDAVAKLGAKDKDSVYAGLAALRLAKAQVEAGQADAAIATLQAINPHPSLQPLVQLRLARLLTEAGKPDEALKLLADAHDSSALEARGDALLAAGKRDEARDTYLKALTGMDVASPQRRLVELKLTDVGGTPPKPAESV